MITKRFFVDYAADKVWMDQMVQGWAEVWNSRQECYIRLPQNFIDIQDDARRTGNADFYAKVTIRRAQRGDQAGERAWKKGGQACFIVSSEDQQNVDRAYELLTEYVKEAKRLYEQGKRVARYRDLPQNKARFTHDDSTPVAVDTAKSTSGYNCPFEADRQTRSYNYTVKSSTTTKKQKYAGEPALPEVGNTMEPKTFQFSDPETAKKCRAVVDVAKADATIATFKRSYIVFPEVSKKATRKDKSKTVTKQDERRYDTDGKLYTKDAFFGEYGGYDEWNRARKPVPNVVPKRKLCSGPRPKKTAKPQYAGSTDPEKLRRENARTSINPGYSMTKPVTYEEWRQKLRNDLCDVQNKIDYFDRQLRRSPKGNEKVNPRTGESWTEKDRTEAERTIEKIEAKRDRLKDKKDVMERKLREAKAPTPVQPKKPVQRKAYRVIGTYEDGTEEVEYLEDSQGTWTNDTSDQAGYQGSVTDYASTAPSTAASTTNTVAPAHPRVAPENQDDTWACPIEDQMAQLQAQMDALKAQKAQGHTQKIDFTTCTIDVAYHTNQRAMNTYM